MPTDPQKPHTKSDFQAAEEITAILEGREKNEIVRILRWVSDKLGLAPAPPVGTGTPGQVLTTPSSQSTHAEHSGHSQSMAGAPTDIKAFVAKKSPKSDMQFACVVAYYHRFASPEAQRKEAITASDLEQATRLADWSRFKKPYVPLNNATQSGYLDRAGGGAFKLNAVGENLVAMTLPGQASSGNGPRPAKKKLKTPSGKRRITTKAS